MNRRDAEAIKYPAYMVKMTKSSLVLQMCQLYVHHKRSSLQLIVEVAGSQVPNAMNFFLSVKIPRAHISTLPEPNVSDLAKGAGGPNLPVPVPGEV